MKKLLFVLLAICMLLAGCSFTKAEAPDMVNFKIEEAAVMEITCKNGTDFTQITDKEVISKVSDSISSLTFKKGKSQSPEGDAYVIKWYDSKAQHIETITVFSDIMILYGKDNINYEAQNGKICYDYIASLTEK